MLVCLGGAGCGDPTEPVIDPRPGWALKPAILLHHGVPAFLSVPESVPRGATFTVAFTTFGPGCDEQGETTSRATATTFEVFPMDWTPLEPPPTCPDSIVSVFARSLQVRFDVAGEARVLIRGRREPGGTAVTLAASVDVR